MEIIALLVIGLVVGALARAVLPGRQDIPLWLTMLIGVGGLLIGGAIFGEQGLLMRIVVGTVIAIGLLALVGAVSKGRTRSHV